MACPENEAGVEQHQWVELSPAHPTISRLVSPVIAEAGSATIG
jgi:hypothetical protein